MIWGISALCHDASLAVIDNNKIIFAAHSERYSKIKNDAYLNQDIISDALSFGQPKCISFYENRWLKKTRQLFDFQIKYFLDFSKFPKKYLGKFNIKNTDFFSFNHHQSHAASGYYTSGFDECVIVVIDGLGEWQTITIWHAYNGLMKCLEEVNYPSSLGLLYSAFTKRCGFKPNEEEYILMGMASYGEPIYKNKIKEDFIDNKKKLFGLKKRCEKGIKNYLPEAKKEDIASSIQAVLEDCVVNIIKKAKKITNCNNLVYTGGVALNCVANQKLHEVFESVWIMPNPGDAGSSLGCAALVNKKKLIWESCFLGHNIKNEYPLEKILKDLLDKKIIGVANGPAEFGPRALGNRSLLADPRKIDTKNLVNQIKHRQKFRPFAPSILEEDFNKFFDSNLEKSPYMQYVFKCKYPQEFPAICHVDNTSRVQTVSEKDNFYFYNLLKLFKEKTGCPMLLNTSLNIKGMPIVNNNIDAYNFEKKYNIKVYV